MQLWTENKMISLITQTVSQPRQDADNAVNSDKKTTGWITAGGIGVLLKQKGEKERARQVWVRAMMEEDS